MNSVRRSIERIKAGVEILKDLRYYRIEKDSMHHTIDSMTHRIREIELRLDRQLADNREFFVLQLQVAARNVAAGGDYRQIPAFELRGPDKQSRRKLRIGLFDNLANQAYITARALRRLGYDVDVLIQDNGFDSYPLARPQWEECSGEYASLADFTSDLPEWIPPAFVRFVPFDNEMNMRFSGSFAAVSEVMELYRGTFGKELPRDSALLLAQYMGHWNYIRAMNDYDVVVVSMSAIMLAVFSPKPVVVCPLGGDLYIRAFDEDVTGLLFRAAFRKAAHLSVPETDYFAYLDRIETKAVRSFMPLIVDTDVYCPGEEPELRAQWQARIGGQHFLLGVCRQDWAWKGSDRLIRGFARFRTEQPAAAADWRLLLQSWGADLDASRRLVTELGLDDVTLWLTMCSKPLLRRRQRAADAVADQFVMEGYGASVLESLAAAKPVIMRPVPESAKHHFRTAPPPFMGAASETEISHALERIADSETRRAAGLASRAWVEAEHGYRTLGPLYMEMFEEAARYSGAAAARVTADAVSSTRETRPS
jgi:glycosyltransferase involved in cell wall biosynthesis